MRSDIVKKGMEGTSRKALFRAMGFTGGEMEMPLIGVINGHSHIMPGQAGLDVICQAVKAGIQSAGGTPMEVRAPGICDGVAMGHLGMRYAMPSREIIADTVEMAAMAYGFDAMVLISVCDKAVSGMLMGAARVNIPAIAISGGPMPKNWPEGFSIGQMEGQPCGVCSVMSTANSMSCAAESLGMSLPGSGTMPAVYADRILLAKETGVKILELLGKKMTPKDIMTRDAFFNAFTADMALGGNSDTILHLMAIANELGVKINLYNVSDISDKTPTLCALNPFGAAYMQDFHEAGGIRALMNELVRLGLIKTNVMSVTGKSLLENLIGAVNVNPQVIRPVESPYSPKGSIAILRGNLSPDGGIVRRFSVDTKMLKHLGPAKLFDCDEDAADAILKGRVQRGDVVIIRYEGPKGGPGMREMTLSAYALEHMALDKEVAIITDGRFSAKSVGACIGCVGPEAAVGGTIALIEEGDIISIDIHGGRLEVLLSDPDLWKRRDNFKPKPPKTDKGLLGRYASAVSGAALGAVTSRRK